jgi:hypothetical protein
MHIIEKLEEEIKLTVKRKQTYLKSIIKDGKIDYNDPKSKEFDHEIGKLEKKIEEEEENCQTK